MCVHINNCCLRHVRLFAIILKFQAMPPTTDKILLEDNESLDTKAPKTLPIIDFSPFLDEKTTAAAKQAVGVALVQAFHQFGFVYLKNFGVSSEDRDNMFAASKEFFDLSLDEKLLLEWQVSMIFTKPQKCAESNRGYVPRGREKNSELDKAGRLEEIKQLRAKNPGKFDVCSHIFRYEGEF